MKNTKQITKRHWFQTISWLLFFFFLSIMIVVAYIAFSRKSGVTSLNVAKIQKLRYDAHAKQNDKK